MITMNRLQPERGKYVVYPMRLTVEQWEKCAQVGRVLGVDRAKAIRAMIDAVTVDDTPAADYRPTVQDVDRESV